MKKIYLFIYLILISLPNFANTNQNDSIKEMNLEVWNPQYSNLLLDLYNNENWEGIHKILNEWYDSCGITEPLFRADLLYHLENAENIETLLNKHTYYFFQNYQYRIDKDTILNNSLFEINPNDFDFIPPYSEFDYKMIEWANKLKSNYELHSLEYAILDFYAGNDTLFYQHLKEKTLPEDNSFLKEYESLSKNIYNTPEWNMELLIGSWMPNNKLKQLGNHPLIGFTYGLASKKNAANLYLAIGFQKTKSLYPIYYADGSMELTKNFQYLGLGIEYLRNFYKNKNHEVWGLVGLSYDNIIIHDSDEELGLESVDVGNVGVYSGIQYRFYLDNNGYIGIRSHYLFTDFSHSGLLQMPGHVWMNALSIGFTLNTDKEEQLRKMHLPYLK